MAGVRSGGSLRIPAHNEALQKELGLAWPFFVGDGFPCAGPLRAEPRGDAGQAPAPPPKCPGSPAASPPNSPDGGPALTASAPEPATPQQRFWRLDQELKCAKPALMKMKHFRFSTIVTKS